MSAVDPLATTLCARSAKPKKKAYVSEETHSSGE